VAAGFAAALGVGGAGTETARGQRARCAVAKVAPAWVQADDEPDAEVTAAAGECCVAVLTASAEPEAATAKRAALVAITMLRWRCLRRVTLLSSALTGFG
jgi:hypothetical protein